MTSDSFFSKLETVSPDPIAALMTKFNEDTTPNKIDVSIGVYKSEEGDPNFVFPCVQKAKDILHKNDPGHCYTNMAGIPEFRLNAQKTIFGAAHDNIASLQAISGSGALHFAIAFLIKTLGLKDFYVGEPAWGNYQTMVKHEGGNYHGYKYFDANSNGIDFDATIAALKNAPKNSVFILQAICHNPTGSDYTKEQWDQILPLLKEKEIFPVFDIAYQGFASGSLDEDAWVVREAYKRGLEFMVCQSYSKNLGLYAERAGCLHLVINDASAVQNVQSQLVNLCRAEISFAPAFGARIATLVQSNEELLGVWKQDVLDVCSRIKKVRQEIVDKLNKLGTPGTWDHVIQQNGLFCFTGLTPLQVQKLIEEHHIYLTSNGRINVAGLNHSNIDRFCEAVDTVVRQYS